MEYILIFISGAIIGFVIGKGPSNKVDADLCAKRCPVCGISDNDFTNAITQLRAEKAQD